MKNTDNEAIDRGTEAAYKYLTGHSPKNLRPPSIYEVQILKNQLLIMSQFRKNL